MQSLEIANVWDKIKTIEKSCESALKGDALIIPDQPARDVLILDSKQHPAKLGLSKREGQARMLHDLASIELQAMELGLRTLIEFPEAPQSFREELLTVTVSEGEHLRLCLEGINDLGFSWGAWPVHTALWNTVKAEDSLLDRILIVHRYLEGSGLDAGDSLIRRLDGISDAGSVKKIVQQINFEEIGHVDFGSRWYREICRSSGIDPQDDFPSRMTTLRQQLPKRLERINRELRLKAGFTEQEVHWCESWRAGYF
ncbi:MAG: DUF455 family protein [Bdellovibrionaceae bacterium]|nr:DUF455 family protein [Pseudobdellovibrionaceae bacterium]